MTRSRLSIVAALLVAGLLVFASSLSATALQKAADTPQSAPSKADIELAKKAVVIIDSKCSNCHTFRENGKKIPWGQDVPQLIKTNRVVPGEPDKSSLYTYATKVHRTYKPVAAEVKILHDWIENGAADPKAPPAPASKPATKPASKPASEPAPVN